MRNIFYRSAIIAIGILFIPSRIYAGLTLDRAGIQGGVIQTPYQYGVVTADSHEYSLYSEIQTGGEFFFPAIGWTVYWGYWNDGVDKPFNVMDMSTFSFSGHALGGRLTFWPGKILEQWKAPLGAFIGIGRHFVSAHYIGGEGYDGSIYPPQNIDATAAEAGIIAEIGLGGPLAIRLQVHKLIPLGIERGERQNMEKWVGTAGLTLAF